MVYLYEMGVAKHKLLLTLILSTLMLSFDGASAGDTTSYPTYSREYIKGAMGECVSIKGFSTDLCNCIITTSNKMTENDPVLFIFIEYAKNRDSFSAVYKGILDADVYNNHNFTNRKERREFVEGKAAIFVHRIKKECG
ncbi:hypothetical protein PMI03_01326 [Rhizobium sp. AP16]|nr:hypothetical protein PMI03_01326 [Rhizobium sp. AP16]